MIEQPVLSRAMFERLTQPGTRLPALVDWLLNEVWSRTRFEAAQDVVRDYLLPGERAVRDLEEVLSAAATRAYDELTATPTPERDLRVFLDTRRPCAAIVFDGLSLREIPLLLRLAEQSGYRVKTSSTSLAAVPSETMYFVQQRLRLSGRVAPSSLPTRRELREAGIQSAYLDSHLDRRMPDDGAAAWLVWSAFPDQTFGDVGAREAKHFATMQAYMLSAWQNTVQQIPRNRPIVITSDHGYIFFGNGLSATRSNAAVQPLMQIFGGERYADLARIGEPLDHPDVAVYADRGVAMLRGRVQLHPPGPDASKLFKHGGLSLMEMITPWLELERAP